MPTPALLLLIAALLPLASFALLAPIGRRLGNPLAAWVATAFIFGSFALSMAGMIAWYNGGQLAGMSWGPGDKPIELTLRWLPVGAATGQEHPGFLDLDIYLDSLTVAMFNTITLILLAAHLFAVTYMADDRRFAAFFTNLALFSFAILALVLSGTLLQLFIFWQLLGLGAYLLIAFHRENPPAAQAALKASLIDRIGDVGFLLGMGILFSLLGNVTFLQMDRWLSTAGSMTVSSAIRLPSGVALPETLLTVAGVALFCAVIAKSALFPLQAWLGDAMHAPMPASAIIQSIASVAAGAYLLGRIFPILTPHAKLVIAIIGLLTLTIGALVALAQRDIKLVLAYSTISQLGLIVMAIGIGSWAGGMFHLITHAFFKALLLLAAASVIRAMGGRSALADYGGLIRKIPLTAVFFAVGVLAISGAPFTCGYYSGEMIFIHTAAFVHAAVAAGRSKLYWLFFIGPLLIACLTAFYMTRCWMLAFWGEPRDLPLHNDARESAPLWFPVIALAALSLIGGSRLLEIKSFVAQSAVETENYCNAVRAPASAPFAGFARAWPITPDQAPDAIAFLEDSGQRLFTRSAQWTFTIGIILGVLVYRRGYAIADLLSSFYPIALIRNFFHRQMYFNEIYSAVAALAILLSRLVAKFDCLLGGGLSKTPPPDHELEPR